MLVLHAHHSPSSFIALYAISIPGAARHTERAQLFLAAKPRQADRCSPPRAYLSRRAFSPNPDPRFARALVTVAHRDAIPDTRHAALRWHDALDSEIKGRLHQILPAAILLAAGADNDPETPAKRIAAQAEVVPCCRGTTLGDGDELVLLVVLVTCRSASTSISPLSAL